MAKNWWDQYPDAPEGSTDSYSPPYNLEPAKEDIWGKYPDAPEGYEPPYDLKPEDPSARAYPQGPYPGGPGRTGRLAPPDEYAQTDIRSPYERLMHPLGGEEGTSYAEAGRRALDVSESLGTGVERGVAGALGTPEEIQRGVNWLRTKEARALGYPDPDPGLPLPSQEDIEAAAKRRGVPFHEPTTTPGRYAAAVGEQIPYFAVGPSGRMLKLGEAAGAGIARQAAADVTKGTPFEPYAAFAGQLAGGVGAGRTLRGAGREIPRVVPAEAAAAEPVPPPKPPTYPEGQAPDLEPSIRQMTPEEMARGEAPATAEAAERGPAGATVPTIPPERAPQFEGRDEPAAAEPDQWHERLKEKAADPTNPYRARDQRRLLEYEQSLIETAELLGRKPAAEPLPGKPPAGEPPIGEAPRKGANVSTVARRKAEDSPGMFGLGAAPSPTAPPVVRITEETGSRPLISQQMGLAERRSAQANSRIEETIRHEYAATPEQRKLYRNYIETRSLGGKAIPKKLTPELRQAADLIQSLNRDIRYELERLDPEAKQGFIDDYLSHMYKDTPALRQMIGGAAEKRIRGGESAAGHLKRRTIPTYDEAERLGLTPKHDTVGETAQESVKMMNRFIAGRDIEEGLKAQGFIHEAASGGHIPQGWARIDSGRFLNRPVYAPKNIARDYNLFFKYPDLPWAQTVLEVNNALRGVKFFGTPYHLLTELVETATHDWSSALENIRNAQFGRAASAAAKALTHTGLGANYWRGSRAFREYLGHRTGPEPGQGTFRKMLETVRGAISPEDRQLVDILVQANAPQARSSIDLFYGDISAARWAGRRGWLKGFKNGVYAAEIGNAGRTAVNFVKGIPGAPLRSAGTLVMAPFRGMGKITSEIMSPLFAELIPKAKFGAMMQKLQDWTAANPGASHEEKLLAAAKIRQNADNLFGEMREDTQFMNRSVLLAAKLTFLSPSWNIGTIRWAGGGIGDVIKATATIPVNVLARAMGEEKPFATPSISKASHTWNPSIATTYGAILETVLAGSVTTYFLTGRAPKDLRDIIAPPTGGVNARGEPDRIRPFADASFIAELARGLGYPGVGAAGYVPQELGAGIGAAIKSKLNTIPTLSIDLLTNRDYRNKPIMGGVSVKEGLEEGILYALREAMTPISLGEKGALRAPDTSNIPMWARAFGMSEAGMQFTNPQGWKALMARQGRPTAETSTPEYKAAHPRKRHEDSMPRFSP